MTSCDRERLDIARLGDGYRIEGSWPFMTGAADARWATATVAITPPGAPSEVPPDIRRIVVPMASLEVHDTWAVASGMRGTGSHAVSAHDVYVPASRSVPLTAEPAVLTGVEPGMSWVGPNSKWFEDPTRWEVHLAEDGPDEWQRVAVGPPAGDDAPWPRAS